MRAESSESVATHDDIASQETQLTSLTDYGRRLVRICFGDRVGIAVFLGVLVVAMAGWRIGIFVTDTTAVANALVNVADGHLAVTRTPYALTLGSQPGLVESGGQFYGRNYGQVFLALPILWLLEGTSLLADPRLVLAGLWCLLVAGLGYTLADVLERPRLATAGTVGSLILFAASLLTATDLPQAHLPLVALQGTVILGSAVVAVGLYRLLSAFHGRRVGVAAGAGAVLATPVGVWASIPKRHVLTAAALVVVLYWFAASREGTDRRTLALRGGMYIVVGLLAFLHAFEAAFLLLVLVPLDLVTAPSNRPRVLVGLGAALLVALVPMFVVNTLISGDALTTPRMLSGVSTDAKLPRSPDLGPADGAGGAGGDPSTDGGAGTDGGGSDGTGGSDGGGGSGTDGTGGSDGGGGSGTDGTSGSDGGGTDGDSTDGGGGPTGGGPGVGDLVDRLTGLVAAMVAMATDVAGQLSAIGERLWAAANRGMAVAPDRNRLYHIFVRSGHIPGVSYGVNDWETVELALLESVPLLGALVWLPVAVGRRLRAGLSGIGFDDTRRQTDLLAGALAVVFLVVYLPYLPLHTQLTLRYVLPVVPLGIYGVARLGPIRRAIHAGWWLPGSYGLAVVGGLGLAAVGLPALDLAVGEAVQLHALVGLGAAVSCGLTIATWPLHRDDRAVAVGLAATAAVATLFVALASLAYFPYHESAMGSIGQGSYALDLVRVVAETVWPR